MSTKKKELYTEYELEFLENKMEELKNYIANRDFSELKDRISYKETKGGGMIPMVVQTIENQRKDLTQAMKDYAELIQTVNKMREDETKRIETRGKTELSNQAEEWLKRRNGVSS